MKELEYRKQNKLCLKCGDPIVLPFVSSSEINFYFCWDCNKKTLKGGKQNEGILYRNSKVI